MVDMLCYTMEASLVTLQQVDMAINGQSEKAFVDIVYNLNLVVKHMVDSWKGTSSIKTIDGRESLCYVTSNCDMQLTIQAIVFKQIFAGVNVIWISLINWWHYCK